MNSCFTRPISSCSFRYLPASSVFRFPPFCFCSLAGALAGSGKLSFTRDGHSGLLVGRLVWFEAGRLRGKRVLRLLCALAADPSYCIRQSKTAFAKRGLQV